MARGLKGSALAAARRSAASSSQPSPTRPSWSASCSACRLRDGLSFLEERRLGSPPALPSLPLSASASKQAGGEARSELCGRRC